MTSSHLTQPPALGEATVRELRDALRGELVLPGDAAYDEARSVWNGMIDRRPAMIARCTGTSDVIAAIGFARSEGLTVAVRGGGHNVAGNATCDGGLVIDLSPMKGIRVDADARTVRAQGGLTWGELDKETQAFGLATTGGLVTTTGIAGFTLGGGIGWMMRKYGLACDNLISADLVTADGQTVHRERNRECGAPVGAARRRRQLRRCHRVRVPPASCLAGLRRARGVAGAGRGGRAALLARLGPRHARRAVHDGCLPVRAARAVRPTRSGGSTDLRDRVLPPRSRGHAPKTTCGRCETSSPPSMSLGQCPTQRFRACSTPACRAGRATTGARATCNTLSDEAIEAILAASDGVPAPLGQLHIHQMGGAMSRVPAGRDGVRQPRRRVPR